MNSLLCLVPRDSFAVAVSVHCDLFRPHSGVFMCDIVAVHALLNSLCSDSRRSAKLNCVKGACCGCARNCWKVLIVASLPVSGCRKLRKGG